MSKHTPGPWQARQVDNQQWEIDAPNGDPTIGHKSWTGFIVVYGCDDDDFKDKGRIVAEANASLIATAPDMLDMLKKCYDALENVGIWDLPEGLLIRVLDLIDKAEGNDVAE